MTQTEVTTWAQMTDATLNKYATAVINGDAKSIAVHRIQLITIAESFDALTKKAKEMTKDLDAMRLSASKSRRK